MEFLKDNIEMDNYNAQVTYFLFRCL